MIDFDKEEYWENRKAGKRGQGELNEWSNLLKESPTEGLNRKQKRSMKKMMKKHYTKPARQPR